ncbi:MAG: sulfatase-like hydrolase/transferase, partial [Candidatus Sumerlaeota bacterium]|nr:sulfatase-like hydrolase/transferase [Candidatus Sumerlaeota bacterium]
IKVLDHDYEGPSILPDEAYCDNWIARNGLALIGSVPKGEPWFIQVNFDGPHPPMDITKSMYENWKDATFPPAWNGGKTAQSAKAASSRRNYAAMINNIDSWLGRFQEELRKRGELESTVIAYCADHGEMLGDRGMSGKSKPYHPSACVPLVVAGPGIQQGVTCDKPVETLDLVATFLDLAGVERPKDMDSRSMLSFLEGKGDLPRTYITSALGGWRLVFDGQYKLIAGLDAAAGGQKGGLVLYDLKQDPHEDANIADSQPQVVERLKALLPPETKPARGQSKRQGGKRGNKPVAEEGA